MLMLKDLRDAEGRYNEAAAELRVYKETPDRWAAHESMSRDGRRELNVDRSHFDRLEMLEQRVERARQGLVATRRAWLAGE